MSSNAANEHAISTLHTLFIIVYLQEMAWVSAPLLISSNVFLHACITTLQFNIESLILSGLIFAFFLLSGVAITVSLYFAHTVALRHCRPAYFLPYAICKTIRILTLITLSLAILLSPTLIKIYFYASVYGLFETIAGAIALEVTIRCIRETKRIRSGRRRQTRRDTVSKCTLMEA